MIKIENAATTILRTFEPGSKTLGIDSRINFDKGELEEFLKSLDEKKLLLLIQVVSFYYCHMQSLSVLLKKESFYQDFLKRKAWSINATLVITAILEFLLKKLGLIINRKDIFSYLKEHFDLIKSKESIEELKTEYYEKYPGNGKCIASFFEKYLDEDEISKIVKAYKAQDRENGALEIKNIQQVVNDVYKRIRSAFVHEIKSNELSPDSISVDLKREGDKSIWVIYPNLSINQLLYYSWMAIFRAFGFEGDMDDYFTSEEQKRGFSVDGTKIRF